MVQSRSVFSLKNKKEVCAFLLDRSKYYHKVVLDNAFKENQILNDRRFELKNTKSMLMLLMKSYNDMILIYEQPHYIEIKQPQPSKRIFL